MSAVTNRHDQSIKPTGKGARQPASPRKRAQRIRLVQYAVLIGALALFLAKADLAQIQKVFFREDLVLSTITDGLGRALVNTIAYTVGAFILGLLAGTILA